MAQRVPTVKDAEQISAMSNPTTRNLRITQTYHELTLALTRLFGAKNVTWCAYATWASKTAGTFIRKEEVPRLIREYLASAEHLDDGVKRLNAELMTAHPDSHLGHSFIVDAMERVVEDVTANVGQGNLIVFAELAPPYARFLEQVLQVKDTSRPDDRVLQAIRSGFKPGSVEIGGQDMLRQAFEAYYRALFEPEGPQKAQLMFLGNALVGYHEQIRLQGPIVGALDAPLKDLLMEEAKSSAKEKVPQHKHSLIESIIDKVLDPIASRIEEEWERFSTRWLMTLALPGEVLDLGKDVPLLTGQMFPPDLVRADMPELVAVLEKLDRTPNTTVGSAAKDWGDLGDRMNYVVDFFRSRQQDQRLYEPPYTGEQVALIDTGAIPPGAL